MRRIKRRKCLCCEELFRPHPRSRGRQKYCGQPVCRAASKAASQSRWLAKPENAGYFSGPHHVDRVRAWRAAHPGYWQSVIPPTAAPLQDLILSQVIDPELNSTTLALQEISRAQSPVLIGLIAHLTGSTLQETILESSRRLLQLGQDILGAAHADQTSAASGSAAPHSGAVQLD
jgi:hypothetical protein